ncbi:MAG: HypC/HybG/HupF family hydrogenase formation chaperone [Planctomycetes bacterium]|nr:HypC/HybG/HupF family hydrogenase formation chaperone [Planctomycetota bacterium]
MCLAVPMKIESIKGNRAVGSFRGGQYDIRLELIETPRIGEFVMVHAGMALDTLNEEEATETLRMLREIDELSR